MTETIDPGLQELLDRYVAAWNAHDVEALTNCWVESGNIVHPWGRYAAGRQAITDLLREEHATEMSGSRQLLLSVKAKPLSDDMTIFECDAAIEDVRAPNGRLYRLPHRLNGVAVHESDRWRFVSLHPSFVDA
jgi:uncharacterized protein (TIGR02246 family)